MKDFLKKYKEVIIGLIITIALVLGTFTIISIGIKSREKTFIQIAIYDKEIVGNTYTLKAYDLDKNKFLYNVKDKDDFDIIEIHAHLYKWFLLDKKNNIYTLSDEDEIRLKKELKDISSTYSDEYVKLQIIDTTTHYIVNDTIYNREKYQYITLSDGTQYFNAVYMGDIISDFEYNYRGLNDGSDPDKYTDEFIWFEKESHYNNFYEFNDIDMIRMMSLSEVMKNRLEESRILFEDNIMITEDWTHGIYTIESITHLIGHCYEAYDASININIRTDIAYECEILVFTINDISYTAFNIVSDKEYTEDEMVENGMIPLILSGIDVIQFSSMTYQGYTWYFMYSNDMGRIYFYETSEIQASDIRVGYSYILNIKAFRSPSDGNLYMKLSKPSSDEIAAFKDDRFYGIDGQVVNLKVRSLYTSPLYYVELTHNYRTTLLIVNSTSYNILEFGKFVDYIVNICVNDDYRIDVILSKPEKERGI